MAMHYAALCSFMASVHCAAATANFLACENHSLDVPWWGDLVEGIEKPIINKGFIKVLDKPGLRHSQRRRWSRSIQAEN